MWCRACEVGWGDDTRVCWCCGADGLPGDVSLRPVVPAGQPCVIPTPARHRPADPEIRPTHTRLFARLLGHI